MMIQRNENRAQQDVYVYIISDSTGETGVALAGAILSQFPVLHPHFRRRPEISNYREIDQNIEEMQGRSSIAIASLMDPGLLKYMLSRCSEKKILCIDIFSQAVTKIALTYNLSPLMKKGLTRELDPTYFNRISAIEFAIKYDDGKIPLGFLKSDLVLIGVSRTSKTPLSMFMATKGYYVSNLPLVPELEIPEQIYQVDPRRIIGLTLSPSRLKGIRMKRLQAMGVIDDGSYANFKRIEKELAYAHHIFDQLGCHVIDVSNNAIETTSSRILAYLTDTFGEEACLHVKRRSF